MTSGPFLVFAIPGDPAQRTGGYIYDAELLKALRAQGKSIDLLRLPDSFPLPDAAALERTAALIAALPDDTLLLIDGMAFSTMPEILAGEAGRLRLAALIHHPLGFETGLQPAVAAKLIEQERAALALASKVIVTSAATKAILARTFDVDPERIAVALPGTAPAPLAKGGSGPGLNLLAVGNVIPRKNFPALITALGQLGDLDWRLDLAGSLSRDLAEVARLRQAIEELGTLAGRISLHGEVDERAMQTLYEAGDLFVSSSIYEGFGMAVAEAVARGLPVVAVDGGTFSGWLSAEAAILLPSGEADCLATALRQVLSDASLRQRLRAGASLARQALPDWRRTAEMVAAFLEDGQ